MKKILASLASVIALSFAGSAFGQTVRENAGPCNALPGSPGDFIDQPTASAAGLPVANPNDLSRPVILSNCSATLQRRASVTVPTTPVVLPTVNLPPNGQVTVTAPPAPPALPPRIITVGRDPTARREAARANAGVSAINGTLTQIFGEEGPIAEAFRADAEALARETRLRREADEREAAARAAADAQLAQAAAHAQNTANTANTNAGNAQNTANHAQTDATAARAVAERALRADRLELALGGMFFHNATTDTNLGAFNGCVSWVHAWTYVASRVQGCYSPSLGTQTRAPGIPFMHIGRVSAGAIFLPRSHFQPLLAVAGTMNTSDAGSLWWGLGADFGFRVVFTDPMVVGPAVGFELAGNVGFGVTHGLGSNNQAIHDSGLVGGGLLNVFVQIQ